MTALSRIFVAALAVGVAGCSQVNRFDDPLASPYARGPNQTTGALAPAQPAPMRPAPQARIEAQPLPQMASPLPPPPPPPGGPNYYNPRASETYTPRAAETYEPREPETYTPRAAETHAPRSPETYTPPRAPETTGTASAPGPRTAMHESWHAGHAIRVTVNPGDTVDGIARRYGASASAIMRANHITAPASIRPGQQLIVPTHSAAVSRAVPATRVAMPAPPPPPPPPPPSAHAQPSPHAQPSARPRPAPEAHPTAVSEAVAPGENVHVVKSGETLSSIAHRLHKSRVAIARANNIGPDAKLSINQQIVIPGTKTAAIAKPGPAPKPVVEAQVAPRASAAAGSRTAVTGSVSPPAPSPAPNPKAASAGQTESAHVVAPSNETTQTAAAASSSEPKLRWPVHGRIVCGFGCKANGQQNDGINVAVPEGTPIKAADDGVVAYAGNELKGYGNLVLVRHSNGFVTAYANASQLEVKRGDQIKRGQEIGRSGQTGSASSPQLHFEVRKGSTPVDPTQYLSGI